VGISFAFEEVEVSAYWPVACRRCGADPAESCCRLEGDGDGRPV